MIPHHGKHHHTHEHESNPIDHKEPLIEKQPSFSNEKQPSFSNEKDKSFSNEKQPSFSNEKQPFVNSPVPSVFVPSILVPDYKVKVLVLCATGKVGLNVSYALQREGFMVYGTTRSNKGAGLLSARGVIPVIADYTKRADLDHALVYTGAKHVFMITDFFGAAKSSPDLEEDQGIEMIKACVAAGCVSVVYSSAADADKFDGTKVRHMAAKPHVEKYLLGSGLNATVVRPAAFFENFDDKANWNPLKKGKLSFLTDAPVKFISTYDVGKLAAKVFADPRNWDGRVIEAASWTGSVHDAAKALETVSKVPTRGYKAMPRWLRWLFLNDLHHMCAYFERGYPGSGVDVDAFRAIIPDALDAEGWFRFHGLYADGTPISEPCRFR
jgi:uncharacterized protein YbjT (DUF2867 family)